MNKIKTFCEIGYYQDRKYHTIQNIYGTEDLDAWELAKKISAERGHPVVLVGGGAPITVFKKSEFETMSYEGI